MFIFLIRMLVILSIISRRYDIYFFSISVLICFDPGHLMFVDPFLFLDPSAHFDELASLQVKKAPKKKAKGPWVGPKRLA